MNLSKTFDVRKESLFNLLCSVKQGKIQLPDFQRSWIWTDKQVRRLLCNVSLTSPIGSVMLLKLHGPQIIFKPRLLEGVTSNHSSSPELLVIDGQQRLTALFQALLLEEPIITKNTRTKTVTNRWYYISISESLNNPNIERLDTIFGLSKSKILRTATGEIFDYSSLDSEFEAGIFPLNCMFNFSEWRECYSRYWNYNSAKLETFDRFESEVIKSFEHYQVPIIELCSDVSREAACQVFEDVNTTGKALTCFDLVTTVYAKENFSLREEWTKRNEQLQKKPLLRRVSSSDFLRAVTLVTTYLRQAQAWDEGIAGDQLPAINCKYRDILDLNLTEYRVLAELVIQGFEEAARLLHSQKFCDAQELPHTLQLVTLAALCTVIGKQIRLDHVRGKLIRWFWCGIFGEWYSGVATANASRDLIEVLDWVYGGESPSIFKETQTSFTDLFKANQQSRALHKSLSILILFNGALDFCTGEAITDTKYFQEQVDSHHIFPKAWCQSRGINSKLYNCIINKTPISKKTNQELGSRAPSVYLKKLEQSGLSRQRLDEILRSHLIEPETLWADDFHSFLNLREKLLISLMQKVVSKPV